MIMLRIATLFYAAVLLLPPPGNICMSAAADKSHTAQTADANSDSVQADDAQAVTDKPASPPPPLMQKTMREVLDKLASEKLLDPASAKQTDTILKALTETLGSSVKYLPAGSEQNYNEALAEAKKQSGNGGGLKITEVGKNTAYCRIPTFNEHNTEQLQQFLDQLGGDPYQAAVFDLRFSDGSSYDQAVATGKILQNTQSPAAIIINGETSGAAEVFVFIAKRQSKTVLIGQPSKGMPFRLEKHVLGNGGRLLVPDRNIAGADLSWPPAPLVPGIEIKQKLTQPQLDELNRRDFGMPRLSRDPALRRAVDLITVVKGLANKHFQSE